MEATSAIQSPRIIIATGLAAAGQNAYARDLDMCGVYKHVEGNELLYETKENWVKAPTDVFLDRVLAATATTSVYESSYSSGRYAPKTDPRELAIDALVERYAPASHSDPSERPSLVLFFKENLLEALVPLMRRIMDRARGIPGAQGVNPETPQSVAAMVADFTTHFEANVQALRDLAARATALGWIVHIVNGQ